ncbi:PREDICTED: peptidyl-prolyl cis-trans isomerase, rhodopsin-specific isozyme-like isoform X2 [Polistes canadensis]|uniref:peptidyl-prolyl cis-trans isomerase, rhodopsin-specific isozyme-like isoform X2 n=1 Tax=Polistes canadensis TaxID=91411 RepID=UPI000718D0CB|nr:PREDICTED: peptidyl-prolyl cis-trans isomerase, rhodopsin-specific isozyme-like isoform X2 [Polistes canadensis]
MYLNVTRKIMKCFLKIVFFISLIPNNKATSFTVTDEVYFDIMIDDHPAGRIVIGLFGDVAPKTVKNFLTIATTGINGKTYAGGDIENGDGTGSISIYGQYFDDENFDLPHAGPFFVSMSNAGENTNGCQFFITTVATPWLDGKHTVFGKVIEGQSVVFKIEQTKTDVNDRPIKPVIISESGIIPVTSSFTVSDDPYNIWEWIKATCIPLSFSFTVLGFFHWMMKQLDI